MPIAPGTRLGFYEIVAPLGAGGMGEVYRARDTRLGREIAIKVLPEATSADPDRRQRFEQEARAASGLNHPNILTIHDIGSVDGTVYIAMELVEGRTLRELIAAEPLPIKKLLDVAVQTADGLAKAHSAGIVHRDLKPENLMISKDGYVKILDFGLAKLTEPANQEASVLPTAVAGPTEPGTVLGTAGYMSPEQASGQAVDFRSDQFTLGSILYEMATGKKAFQRRTGAETLVAIIREEPEPLQQLAPKAPAPVRWIVERCLAKDPEERYASTKDLARDLRSVRDHLSETSVSGGLAIAEPAPSVRRGWLLPAALAMLAGAGLALLAARGLRLLEPPRPRYQRLTFRRGTVFTARFAPDNATVVYGAAWEGNPIEVFSTRPESPESRPLGFPSSDVLSVASTGEVAISIGRHFVHGWESDGTLARVPLSGGAPRELAEQVEDADWSPNGKELAVVRRGGDQRRLEYPIGNVLHKTAGWISHPRVSPDGRLIAFFDHPLRGDSAGRPMAIDTAGKIRLTGPDFRSGNGLAWSPKGDEVWASGGPMLAIDLSGRARLVEGLPTFVVQDAARDGRVLLKGVDWRREIFGMTAGDSRERSLTWLDWSFPTDISNDGKLLLFDEQSGAAAPHGGSLCYVRKTDASPAIQLGLAQSNALSPDGKWALTASLDGKRLTLLPTGAGDPKPLPVTGLTYVWSFFSPDGKGLIATASEPGHGPRLYVQDLQNGRPRAITPEGYSLFQKAISPDGKTIAAVGPDRRIALCSTEGGAPRPLPGAAQDELPLSFTTDGRSLYVARVAMPAHVFLIESATGQRRLWKDIVPPDPAGVLAIGPILIAPDGKSYVYSYRRMLDDLYLATGLR